MSISFEILSSIRPYNVTIEHGSFEKLPFIHSDMVMLCDAFFEAIFLKNKLPTIPIMASEKAKNLDDIGIVITRMRELGLTRKSSVVAIGGGCIQDIVTFCSSIYMRGVSWQYLPSTLLSMVDSCIGGKSAINVGQFKNLVGNFYPPREIIIDPNLVLSLSDEQRIAGLCEAAKITFAHSPALFMRYLDLCPDPKMDNDNLIKLIELSLKAKKWFIEIDEFDQNERQLLNFGHTFGHAIEAASNFIIPHGLAVGMGMLSALAFTKDHLGIYRWPSHVDALKAHIMQLLLLVGNFKNTIKTLVPENFLDHLKLDKKNDSDSYAIISIDKKGLLQKYQINKTLSNGNAIKSAFDTMLSELM